MAGPITNSPVGVTNGLFTVTLDFGDGVFTGDARWLDIGVRTNGGTGDFTTLAPRQAVTPAPYALYSSGAGTAGSASNLLGILSAGQLSGTYSNVLNFSNGGNSYSGDGSGLTSLNANNLSAGTLPDARLSGTYSSALTLNNAVNNFTGNGNGLTSLNANALASGTVPDARLSGTYSSALTLNNAGNSFTGSGSGLTSLNANNLSSGTLPSARLSGTYSGALTLNNAANSFTGSGSGLTSLNASALASGTVPDARLSANVALLNTGPTFTGSPLQVQNAAPVAKCVIASDTTKWIQMTYNGSLGPLLQGNGYQRLWIDAAGAGEVMLGYGGDNVGIALDQLTGGTQSPSARLDVNGATRVRGTVRMGSEAGTSEAPSPAGMVLRRINSTDSTAGQIVARTDSLTLERDGSNGGFLIRYPASPSYLTIACMGIDNAGNQKNFYRALSNPSTAGTVQIYTNSQNVVHFECTFGRTFDSDQHLTRVFLSRYDADYYWSGDVVSTYNQ